MGEDSFTIVKSNLALLTTSEKETVIKLLQSQGVVVSGNKVNTKQKVTAEEHLLYEVLKKRINVYYSAITKGRDKVALLEASIVLVDYWNKLKFPEGIRKNKLIKMRLYDEIIKVTVNFLKENQIPINGRTVLNQRARFIGLLNKAYPDYPDNLFIKLVLLTKAEQAQVLAVKSVS